MYSSNNAGKNKMTVIEIGKKAGTELGRLLSLEAITPFAVVNFINNPDEPEWPSVKDAAVAASTNLQKYVENTPLQNRMGDLKDHHTWITPDDEDRLLHLIRCKIECNSFLLHMFIESRSPFVFMKDQENVERFDWLSAEMDHLRRYLRKSFLQGFQQPYIRPGRRKPYKWKRGH